MQTRLDSSGTGGRANDKSEADTHRELIVVTDSELNDQENDDDLKIED